MAGISRSLKFYASVKKILNVVRLKKNNSLFLLIPKVRISSQH